MSQATRYPLSHLGSLRPRLYSRTVPDMRKAPLPGSSSAAWNSATAACASPALSRAMPASIASPAVRALDSFQGL